MIHRTLTLRAKMPLVAPDSARAWIELAYEGEWKGHPAGEFTFDLDVFRRICTRFDAQDNPIPLTYGHPDHGNGQPIPGAGFILALEIREGSLWGFAEFTPRAAEMIRQGEMRFCSVVVDLGAIDRESGEEVGPEMYEVGLTNTPFLDGQKPIQLARKRPMKAAPRKLSTNYVVSAPPEKLFPGIKRR